MGNNDELHESRMQLTEASWIALLCSSLELSMDGKFHKKLDQILPHINLFEEVLIVTEK